MDELKFNQLGNRPYIFTTYVGEMITGIPTFQIINNKRKSFIIPLEKINFFNTKPLPIEDKIKEGILIPIKPEIIEFYQETR